MTNRFVEAACASALVLTACSPETPERPNEIELKEMTGIEVVCVNIEGTPEFPDFTEELCAETTLQVTVGQIATDTADVRLQLI